MSVATFEQYFRSSLDDLAIQTNGELSSSQGYFRLGDTICYGRCSSHEPSNDITKPIPDVSEGVVSGRTRLGLPFDLSEVAINLRQERYPQAAPTGFLESVTAAKASRDLYYSLRPFLPISARKHLQRARLNGWESIAFPRWPVDSSVDSLMERVMTLALRSGASERIPFIWFWPDGARGCAMMTHDVEGVAGRDFCSELMDLDDSFRVKSAFQIVPESSDVEWRTLADRLRGRGFEVNVHDLNHDGYLFHDKQEFRLRAEQINRYVREFECRGFRSGAMYREQQWYGAFDFSYDMSVPNVAHLEPQRGGCCTVMPYFVDHVLELPLTTTQDYSLFHILGDYSIDLWKRQIELILERHGLISFIVHPDYVCEPRALGVYRDLLAHLAELRAGRRVWMAFPGEIDRWWRDRAAMRLVRAGDSWRIEGRGNEQARLAWACLDEEGRLVYMLDGERER